MTFDRSQRGAGGPWPVCLVITELDVGGAERALVRLATGLDRARWRPSVLALGPEGPLASPIREAGVEVECLGVNPRRPVAAVRTLAKALRARSPRLVQSFLFHANVATRLAVRVGFARSRRPVVLAGHRVAEREKGWHLLLDRLTNPLADGAVCVSDGVRRFSREHGGWPDARLTVIPNGIDVEPFDRAEAVPRASLGPGVPDDAWLMLFVGRLTAQKGLDVLFEAAERLASIRPDLDWRLALAGDGPEGDRLDAWAKASPTLASRVYRLGPRDDVPGLLKAADLLVLPSRWEGMPNAVLEAMAARRAVVATNVEGTEELVVPGETGWLVDPGDPDVLASALLEAADDRDRLRRLGEAGRRRIEDRFTATGMVEAYQRLWDERIELAKGSV